MRHAITVALLLVAATAAGAWAADTTTQTKPKAAHAKKTAHATAAHGKPAHAKADQMSPEKRRDLERRIEALEQKYEMQPAAEPGAK